jgi:uracil-DNA glycosylase family 4
VSDGLALSALDWWVEAGVDTIVDDLPYDWLSTARPPVTEAATPNPNAPISAPAAANANALPATLVEYRRWLIADAPIPGPPDARIDALGDAATGTMVIVDMPEAEDRTSGTLLSGDAGALFDRMLAAMKLDRAAIYMAPFSPARPAIGRLGDADCKAFAPLMLHHIALAAPKRLLLLGDAPARALLGKTLAQARGETRSIDIAGVAVPAIASFHPRFVLERPDYRKPAWADLQMFMAL